MLASPAGASGPARLSGRVLLLASQPPRPEPPTRLLAAPPLPTYQPVVAAGQRYRGHTVYSGPAARSWLLRAQPTHASRSATHLPWPRRRIFCVPRRVPPPLLPWILLVRHPRSAPPVFSTATRTSLLSQKGAAVEHHDSPPPPRSHLPRPSCAASVGTPARNCRDNKRGQVAPGYRRHPRPRQHPIKPCAQEVVQAGGQADPKQAGATPTKGNQEQEAAPARSTTRSTTIPLESCTCTCTCPALPCPALPCLGPAPTQTQPLFRPRVSTSPGLADTPGVGSATGALGHSLPSPRRVRIDPRPRCAEQAPR
ncbi:uncharacterized protein PFL1_05441 [Pseudozyma flocculosa PF-1]|uniref:Uncharacterized protein n=1 Tax=Pseudozyma flocculosa PF-1 TaxID=1277687 RepID=A0A061H599_9BASI|nr:uncharacterized protein PFL1_05441 [Pseudozyma flocculosa PF-1]EPQ27160.1 hypothetical protein PFL1_05441 [Pseudozyma flocculosa PF-1]